MCFEPNIFNFAMKELSQDAFICWLIAYLDDPKKGEMYKTAKDFIIFLYNEGKQSGNNIQQGTEIKLEHRIEGKKFPWQQYKNTDIYFEARIGNELYPFIIEDKANTSFRDEQLKKYVEKIKNNLGNGNRNIIKIGYKTGYSTSYDKSILEKNNKFTLIDSEKMCNFLKSCTPNNVIFSQYRDYITKKSNEHQDNYSAFENEDFTKLSDFYVQLRFMDELAVKLEDLKDTRRDTYYPTTQPLYPNVYQKQHTQLYFYASDEEELRYKIDKETIKKEDKYYIAIKQHRIGNHQNLEEKFAKYRVICTDLARNYEAYLNWEIRTPRRARKKEFEIAILFFDKNKLQNILKYLPVFHADFFSKCRTSGLTTQILNENDQLPNE